MVKLTSSPIDTQLPFPPRNDPHGSSSGRHSTKPTTTTTENNHLRYLRRAEREDVFEPSQTHIVPFLRRAQDWIKVRHLPLNPPFPEDEITTKVDMWNTENSC